MAIIKSAKKAIRNSANKRVFNIRKKKLISTEVKKFEKAVAAKDKKAAEALLPTVYKVFDKARKTGLLKANTAARRKSKAARMLAGI